MATLILVKKDIKHEIQIQDETFAFSLSWTSFSTVSKYQIAFTHNLRANLIYLKLARLVGSQFCQHATIISISGKS